MTCWIAIASVLCAYGFGATKSYHLFGRVMGTVAVEYPRLRVTTLAIMSVLWLPIWTFIILSAVRAWVKSTDSPEDSDAKS